MQEIKTSTIGIRVTDTDLARMNALKLKMGVPSVARSTLAYDLLSIGIREMERRYGLVESADHGTPCVESVVEEKKRASSKIRKGGSNV